MRAVGSGNPDTNGTRSGTREQLRARSSRVISPAGFEDYFREMADNWGNLEMFQKLNDKYALEMRFDSVPELCRRFDLTFPAL